MPRPSELRPALDLDPAGASDGEIGVAVESREGRSGGAGWQGARAGGQEPGVRAAVVDGRCAGCTWCAGAAKPAIHLATAATTAYANHQVPSSTIPSVS